jgi:hypothetical protein
MSGVSAQIDLSIVARLIGAADLGNPSAPVNVSKALTITAGTGALGQADILWADQRTLAASGTENLDLAGVLSGLLGGTIAAAEITAIYIEADAGNTNDVVLFGAGFRQGPRPKRPGRAPEGRHTPARSQHRNGPRRSAQGGGIGERALCRRIGIRHGEDRGAPVHAARHGAQAQGCRRPDPARRLQDRIWRQGGALMATDASIPIRRATLALMKADAGLTAIVDAARIYPQTTPAKPTFPFVRSGAPNVVPIRAACVDGCEATFAVHGFAKDRMSSNRRVETAEDYAGRIGSAIASALDRQSVDIPGGKARILWTGSQLLMDPDEAGCFHTVQQFKVRALTS